MVKVGGSSRGRQWVEFVTTSNTSFDIKGKSLWKAWGRRAFSGVSKGVLKVLEHPSKAKECS